MAALLHTRIRRRAAMRSPQACERIDLDLPSSDPVQLQLHTARYEFASRFCSETRALDIACGTGYGTAMLARGGAQSVTGVDLDSESIEQARRRFKLESVSYLVGDAEAPPVSGSFDLIVSFETIEHLVHPTRFLSSVHRLLTRDGTFLVSTPCRETGSIDDRPENPFHVREWNQGEFVALLEEYFRDVTIYGQLIEFA